MTIRNRLKLIGMVPITLLVLLSSYFFITSYTNYEAANSLKIFLKNSALLNSTMVEVGKERGLTSLNMGSEAKIFKGAIIKQRTVLNKHIQNVKDNLITENSSVIPFLANTQTKEREAKKYTELLENFNQLNLIRKKVDSNKINFKKIFFEGYTHTLSTPTFDTLLLVKHYALNPDISSLISSLVQLYTAQENAALERDFVSYYMTKKLSMAFDEIALWDSFKTKANIFDIKQVTNADLREALKEILENAKAKESMGELAMTSSAIQTDVDNGDYAEEATDWFTLQTKKVNILSKAELIVSNALWKKSDIYLHRQLILLGIASAIWLLSFVLGYLGYTTARDITRNIQELEDVLNKAVDEMRNSDDYLTSDAMAIENIELDTHEGTKIAYKFLETLVQTAKDDKMVALQANEAKSLFLANMSHEIRTPLNGIVGFTEILRSTDLTEEQNEFLAIIDKSSENLLSLINNILDLSKIESNKIEIESIVFDSAIEFESAVETYSVAATEKGIDLNYYMDPNISPKLKGDPTKIKEIVINLLSNAIKFTSHGGNVNLEITKIIDENDVPRVKFVVQDSGIGMTKDQQSRVFEAFSQADDSVTRKYGGTGLGLTISKQFAELMGGDLELTSVKDQGTTFFFAIPLEEVTSTEINYTHAFTDLTIGKYEQEIPTKLDTYIDDYLKYFGPEVKLFESIGEIKDLENANVCKNYWVDIDKAKQNILDAIQHMDKSKLVIIANVTSRQKVEALGVPQSNVIFKPITLSKLKNILTLTADTNPQLVEESVIKQETKFDARVLVTEDNMINQKLIKRILETHGITVDLANNGLESFSKRRGLKYDLIFMDIQMPVMDGIEATHAILEYENEALQPHIPIVALTANALKGDRERFLNEGMDEYITKPIETTELLYILNKFLADHAIHDIETYEKEKKAEEEKKAEAESSKGSVEVDDVLHVIEPEVEEEKKIIPETSALEVTNLIDIDIEEEKKEEIKPKKILIAKKFLLAKRVLSKVLDNLNYEYEVLADNTPLESELALDKYDILFADAELITQEIANSNKNIAIISPENSNISFTIHRGESISTDKEDIENIIKKYRG